MKANYPIMLKLEGKKAVVVGGGKVAGRKVNSLIGTGASVTVISPEATDEIKRLASEGKIKWEQKAFFADDMEDAFMIFAATNDPSLNQLIKESAGGCQLVTIADDPEGSDFHLPSHFQRGRLSIAVSTGGASPTLARKIREQLEQQIDETYEDYLDFLFSKRKWILHNVEDPTLKRNLLTAIVSAEFLNSENREADFNRIYESNQKKNRRATPPSTIEKNSEN